MSSRSRWALLAIAAALEGCVKERSILSPAGPAARWLADLGWPPLITFTVTSAAMWGLIAWAALRRTGTLDEHEPLGPETGRGWIVIGGFAVPTAAFAIFFIMTLRTMAAFPMDHRQTAAPEIRVVGHQWWWQVEYRIGSLAEHVVAANEIHIPTGRPIEVQLESVDVIHSLWVPRLHGKVDLVPGLVNRIRLQADRPGVYPGSCSEFCGQQHAHMQFVVVAQPPGEFDGWLAAERSPAAEPTAAEAKHGRALFMERACVLCHTVRGTEALADVGPDLTHIASRLTLAAGSWPNDVATLHAWVVNAPSLKPGIRMPALTEFTGAELHDLVAYLRTLK